MIEPLTGIGFAIGVVGFLASTLSSLDLRVTRFRECRELLLDSELQLKTSHGKLEAWRSKWLFERGYEDELYLYLWGQDGFDDVRARCRSLQDLSARIKTLLRRPSSSDSETLLPAERLEWQNLLRQEFFETGFRMEVESIDLNLPRRIAFSLFENCKLQEKVARFKNQVENLEESAKTAFGKLRDGDFNGAVSPKDIRNLVALKRFIDRVSSFGCSTFESSQLLENIDTALEINPPEEEQDLDWWTVLDDLHVDLLMISDAAPRRRAGRFRIIHLLEAYGAQSNVSELIQRARMAFCDGARVETNQEWGRMLTELECPSSRSRHFRRMLIEGVFKGEVGKSFDLERSSLIYGLAHWFVQFWNTPWTIDMCSCRIRQVRVPNLGTRYSLTAGVLAIRGHSDCQPIDIASQKMALLGKTLAEIALAVPMSLDVEGGELIFKVNGVRKTRAELLADLAYSYGRKTITKAVRFCLDPARVEHQQFLPENMEPFCQNILQP